MTQPPNNGAHNKSAKAGIDMLGAFQANRPPHAKPAALHEAALSQAKDAYAQMKSATEAASGIFGGTLEAAQANGISMTLKAVEIAKANVDGSFEFLKALIGAKTISEAVEVQTAYARKQFGILNGQIKDLQDASQKAASDFGRPTRVAFDTDAGRKPA